MKTASNFQNPMFGSDFTAFILLTLKKIGIEFTRPLVEFII